MSLSKLDPTIAELVESRRLGPLEQSRHRFTVSREEGLLRLREQVVARSGSRWAWTLALVRAANVLSEAAEAKISVEQGEGEAGELRITTLDLILPGAELDGLDLSDLLAGALAPDLGLPLGEVEPDQCFARVRMLLGRALNGALAHEPVAVELQTVAGGRRFARREQSIEGRDPYAERKIGACAHASRVVVRLHELRPGIGSRLGRWLTGRGELDEELVGLWRAHRAGVGDAPDGGGEADDGDGVRLGPGLRARPLELGEVARYWPESPAEDGRLWLIRDGLRLLPLDPALVDQQVSVLGWIDCPGLRLTADERGVVRDAHFDQLVAWLHDYRDQVGEGAADGEGGEDGAAEAGVEFGPRSLAAGVRAADERVITVDELAESAHRGRELVYVWRHQRAMVPAWAKSRIAALWPSEEQQLRAHLPELRLVPLRALGQTDVDPADLTSLRAGCFEPIALVKHCPVELGDGPSAFGALEVSVEAFVHRAPTATQGFIVILAYERRVAQLHESGQVFPGVTLIARVRDPSPAATLDVAALRADQAAVAAIASLCRSQTRRHWEALLAHVMGRAKPWENALLRSCLLELRAQTIGLRYRQTDAGLRLAWIDSILLDVEIGAAVEGGRKTLRDALRTVRERGFVILAHPHKRHRTLVSRDPELQPWLLDDDNIRALLVRVVGHASVLDMPVVAEAHPLVVAEPVDDQRHLVRERATIERELGRSATDPLARQRLIGHLLVSRGLDQPSHGLESAALFERYDPRAQHPTRLVSLDAILAERPGPGLVPAGAVDRELPRPMIEATAGVAALLAEVAELEPGETTVAAATIAGREGRGAGRPSSERSSSTPIRRRGRAAAPMLSRTLAHPLAVGRLEVAADASSTGLSLWAGGLRVGELSLPEPLGRVSGRLVLTAQGRKVGATAIRELATAEARALIAEAPVQRTLLPPGSAQRERLDHFVAYLRSVLAVDDRFGLADALGLTQPPAPSARVLALRDDSLRAAPLRPLRQRDALLVDVVRQSLAMRVAFDTAMLSWRPAKLSKRRRDGTFELEFGLRNRWIQRGLDEDRALEPEAHRRAALFAGLFVVAAFFEQANEGDDVDVGPEHLFVALWRLLSLAGL